MKRTFSVSVTLLAAMFVFLHAGCTRYMEKRVNFDLATEPTVYTYAWVERNAPHVSVYPAEEAIAPPTVLMVPLRATQRMAPGDAATVSREVSRTISQVFMQERLFPIVEYDAQAPLFMPQQSLALARAKGAEMLIGGYITSVMTGGSVGYSQLSFRLECYDVLSGELIWSITHAGNMTDKPSNDYILFIEKTKLPPDPIYAIARALGWDISQLFRDWLAPESGTEEAKESDVDIKPIPTQSAF